MPLVLDPKRTSVHAFTGTEGLFARFAHDLDIVARDIEGHADDHPPASAHVRIRISGLHVVGVVKKGRTDEGALSKWERDQIMGRMATEVFRGTADITAEATMNGDEATIAVITATGRQFVRSKVTIARDPSSLTVKGECTLSLRTLGIGPLKGPMGAFTVADAVRIHFDATFG